MLHKCLGVRTICSTEPCPKRPPSTCTKSSSQGPVGYNPKTTTKIPFSGPTRSEAISGHCPKFSYAPHHATVPTDCPVIGWRLGKQEVRAKLQTNWAQSPSGTKVPRASQAWIQIPGQAASCGEGGWSGIMRVAERQNHQSCQAHSRDRGNPA